MKISRIIGIIGLALSIAFGAAAATPQWEQLPDTQAPAYSADSEKLEVSVRDGYIYLYSPKPVTVKVMSIVGQLISEQRISAGTSRLKVSTRGIYILKAGDSTLRVTI